MAKRQNDELDGDSKREKTINFSSTEFLKNKVKIGDKSASVVGYIEKIIDEKTYTNKEDNSDFKILKVIINNNDGIRVQCNIYNENIPLFLPQLRINEKILLETVSVMNARLNGKSNVNYELNFNHYSTITKISSTFRGLKPIKISFDEIPTKKGYIEIQGFLRNCFVVQYKNDMNKLFGAITDGKFKLDIYLTKTESEEVEIERGTKLKIVGDLGEHGSSYALKINSLDQIKILNETKMELEDLLQGNEIFLIKENVKEEE